MSKKTTDVLSTNIGEFELIRRFFCSDFPSSPDTVIAIGDDASVVKPPANSELIQSIDTQVAGVHFPVAAPAHLIAQRALRCAVSDLAAMGAAPQGFHLALTLPESDIHWLKDFSDGLKKAAQQLNIALIGGDTTRGKQLVISVAVQGWVPTDKNGKSRALTRSGAQPADLLYLSGPVGAAAVALQQVLKNPADISGHAQHYYFPEVHLQLGKALLDKASACMDISDGLIQDAGHIASASSVQLVLDAERIQLSQADQAVTCLNGGDDYQLLFALPAATDITELKRQFKNLHGIGEVTEGSGVQLKNASETVLQAIKQRGFNHF